MNEVSTKLIEVFSRKPADKITHHDVIDEFSAIDYPEVQEKPDFDKIFNRVRRAKLKLERIDQKYPQAEKQALHCLSELHLERGSRMNLPDSFRETEALIRKNLYPKWKDIQEEFDTRCEVLRDWNHVFLSYTNRDAYATNQCYDDFIISNYGDTVNPVADPKNKIAPIIAKFFQQSNLNCFIDFEMIECGDVIEEKILNHSSSAIAFVQLLEPQLFQEPTHPSRNWCKEEFDSFSLTKIPQANEDMINDRYFFILARGDTIEDILPAIQPSSYSSWIEEASSRDYLKLNKYKNDFDGLRKAVADVAKKISIAQKEIINTMLASW